MRYPRRPELCRGLTRIPFGPGSVRVPPVTELRFRGGTLPPSAPCARLFPLEERDPPQTRCCSAGGERCAPPIHRCRPGPPARGVQVHVGVLGRPISSPGG